MSSKAAAPHAPSAAAGARAGGGQTEHAGGQTILGPFGQQNIPPPSPAFAAEFRRKFEAENQQNKAPSFETILAEWTDFPVV